MFSDKQIEAMYVEEHLGGDHPKGSSNCSKNCALCRARGDFHSIDNLVGALEHALELAKIIRGDTCL